VATPTGKPRWNVASVRWILRNPAYTGRALTNRTRVTPARQRKSAMLPAGPGVSHAPRPPEDWIEVPVPQIVSEETFAQVQAKLDGNQQSAARNTRHEYLLRALVSCGACRLSCTGRQSAAGYRYYLCRGRTDALRAAQGQRCRSRYIPAGQLDELVWADLCTLLTDPAQIAHALQRARGGAWLPQELQARQAAIRQALGQLERQRQRLLDAYLAEVVGLPELERKRQELDRRHATLLAQQRQLEAAAGQRLELEAVAEGIERFCQTVRAGLATATFTQRRQLAELLIDRVIVTGGDVEIRYVLPTSPDGPHRPFCQLRKDHLDPPAGLRDGDEPGQRDRPWCPAPAERERAGVTVSADQQHAVPVVLAVAGDLEHGPVVVAGALGARAGAQPLPGTVRNDLHGSGSRDRRARARSNIGVGADREHVPHVTGADGLAQLAAAVHFVAATHQQALTLFREVGERGGEAFALLDVGQAQAQAGDYLGATAHLTQALALFRDLGNRYGEAGTLDQFGIVERIARDYPASAASHQRALGLYREVGDRLGQAEALNNLGELLACSPAGHQAQNHHAQALIIARDIGAPLEEARALEGIGHCRLQNGNPGEGADCLRQALAIYQRIGSPRARHLEESLRQHQRSAAPLHRRP
jgi:tetratricopeptide (TPR) repeat protein